MVKQEDIETGIPKAFQILQDLRLKQTKAHQPNTTFMTSTTRQPKALKTLKSCETSSQKAGTTTYTDNMSQIQTSFRTIPPHKTSTYGTTTHSTR